MVIAEAPSDSAAAAFDKVDTSHLPGEIAELYKQLAREDLPIHQSPQVAQGLPYITGETVRQVLNQVIGIHRWSFKVVSQELVDNADHIIVLGRLTVRILDFEVVHEAFGGKQVIRSRATGQPVNLGFDYKAAQTEALKKCATDIGIGLWLSRKESAFWDAQEAGEPPKPGTTRNTQSRPTTSPNGASAGASSASANGSAPRTSPNGSVASGSCVICGDRLGEVKFDDKTWTPETLADRGSSKFGHVVCWPHYMGFNAQQNGKPTPKNGKTIPPEAEWAINRNGTASAPAPRTRPAGSPKAGFLDELKAGLAKIAASKGDNQKQPADADQIEWAEGVFYDAIGDSSKPMLAYLFGANLSVADIDAIEEWTTVLDTDHWAERLEHAVPLLPQAQAA